MSNIPRTEYNILLLEKESLKRSINRKQENIKKLIEDIKTLYQAKEEKLAKDQFIIKDKHWDVENKAFELWVNTNDVDKIEDIIVTLKRKKALFAAECSEIQTLLKNMDKTAY